MKNSHLETVLTFVADPSHEALPLHARVQRAIRKLILDGALPARRSLPASRILARSLGVSRDTVEAAYCQLHADGLIVRRIGIGSFVSEGPNFVPARGTASARAVRLPLGLARRGCAIGGVGDVTTSAARAFTPGVPETRAFPLALWDRLGRQVSKERGTAALDHGDPQGEESLRRVIADYVNLERGGRATPERVLVVTSSQQALWLCATLLFDVGDGILVEDPAYPRATRAFAANGLTPIPLEVDRSGMSVERLAARDLRAKGVYVVPSHQYPTGATLSLDRRHALIEWAVAERSWIIEDDYDGEFHHAGRPTCCIQGLDPHDRTIYVGTFTKSVFPGLRLAYLVLPPRLVQPMVAARTLLDGFPARIPQLTLARFIEGGHFGAHVRAMRGIYVDRLEMLTRSLRSDLGGLIEARPPAAGLQMPCLLAEPEREAETVEAAARAGVALAGLSLFRSGPHPGEGWLMGFAAHTPAEIEAAVARLSTALRRSRRPH